MLRKNNLFYINYLEDMNDDLFVDKTLGSLKKFKSRYFKDFFVFNEISSTNAKAKDLIRDGAAEGSVVISKIQKSGRGRFDRVWKSPEGGLYISFILKPDVSVDKYTLLPLLSSIAVSKTLSLYGISNKIKWPNDVRIKGKKIAGILLESNISKNQINYIILGIGVNLNIDKNSFPDEIIHNTTSVLSELNKIVDYHRFLKDLILNLDKYISIFEKEDFVKIISEWKILSDTFGKRVKITSSSGEIVGKAVDVDEFGFLIVATDSGEYKKIMSGDCFYFKEL